MGTGVAEQSGSSRTARPVHGDLRSRVVIVPGKKADDHAADSATNTPEPPFLGDQHETIVSKQAPGSSSQLSVDSALANPTLNPNEMGAVLRGETLGHFLLEEFVGGGGMGVVFRATDLRLGRTVAVKILTRDRTDTDTLRRFQNEAQSAARLDHENIARVYYVGEDRGLHFIVFEFIEGMNIRDLVQQRGALPVEEAINYVLQVAEALEHASIRNVIHRDIKPSNVLVTTAGRAKLVDMGLARLHQMDSDAADLTASGVTLGTFDYISPEQARDPRMADVRSDLYSLGCTFYYMLTGRPPFPEGTVLQKLLSHSTEDPTDPRMFRPDLDEQIVQTLQRLLAKQPAQRYQRPSELIGHLLLVAERLNIRSIARNGAVWAPPSNSALVLLERALPWALPLVLFLAAVLMLAGPWSSSPSFEFPREPIQLEPVDLSPPAEVPAIDNSREADAATDASIAVPASEPPVAERPAVVSDGDNDQRDSIAVDAASKLPKGDSSAQPVPLRSPQPTVRPEADLPPIPLSPPANSVPAGETGGVPVSDPLPPEDPPAPLPAPSGERHQPAEQVPESAPSATGAGPKP